LVLKRVSGINSGIIHQSEGEINAGIPARSTLEFLELFWNSWNSSGILGIILEFLEFFWNYSGILGIILEFH
jgi:hypothetical protein